MKRNLSMQIRYLFQKVGNSFVAFYFFLFLLPNFVRSQNLSPFTLPPKTVASAMRQGEANRVRFLPVLKEEFQLEAYFGDTKNTVARNVGLSISSNSGSLYAELLSDNIYLSKLGFGRIGFGALIANSDDTTAASFDRFFNAGGNGIIYLLLPLIYYQPSNQGFAKARADLVFLPRVASDIPAMNSTIEDPTYNVDIGLEGRGFMNSVTEKFCFFAQVRVGYVSGSKKFYENLSLAENNRNSFVSSKWTFGVDLKSLIRISVSKPLFGPAEIVKNQPLIVGVQFIRDQE